MNITSDLKEGILNFTKSIENIEVVYKKKDKYNGTLAKVKQLPFEIIISDIEDDIEHTVDLKLAQEITVKFFDGTIKTYKDPVS